MKKYFLFITIILTSILFISGCSSNDKKVLSTDSFKEIAKNNDLSIMDSSEQYKDDEKVNNVLIAYNAMLQLEFYEMKDDEYAKDMFESNKQTFSEKKENTSSESSEKEDDYESYSLITTDEFLYVERRNNIILYLNVPVEAYNDAREVIEYFK